MGLCRYQSHERGDGTYRREQLQEQLQELLERRIPAISDHDQASLRLRRFSAAPTLNRFIDPQREGLIVGDTCGHQQTQQDAAGAQARPDGAIEDAMRGLAGRRL